MSTSTAHSRPNDTTFRTTTSTKAVVAFVTSFTVPLVALVFAVLALREIRHTGQEGRGYAIAGLLISLLWGGLLLFIAVAFLMPIFNPWADYIEFGDRF